MEIEVGILVQIVLGVFYMHFGSWVLIVPLAHNSLPSYLGMTLVTLVTKLFH